ncbi:MAG: pitrilysin family protein [Candidatus Acidiferrales bacterium]
MMGITARARWIVAAVVMVAAAGWSPARAQDASSGASSGNRQAAAPAKAEAQKGGTGEVPAGVKLESKMPPAAPARAFHLPKVASKTLPNGLRIFVVTDHREPAVAVKLVLTSAGAVNDPAGLTGLAEMTANLLTQGTQKRPAQQIANEIDFVGGELSASADKDATGVRLEITKNNLQTGMDLMSDVVLHPTFQQEELDRQRQQLLSALQVQRADPEYLATAVFSREVYPGSPYGLPSEGTLETAGKFDRESIVKFHASTYVPNEALIAFAGDITPEAAFELATRYFGGWEKKEVAQTARHAPAAVSGVHLWVVDKPDAVQTQIRMGRLGIRHADPDYIPLLVANHILGGGGFNSRLNTEVRINKGLTYDASSSFHSMKYTGSFAASTYTRTEATVEATKLMVELLAKMAADGATPAEMDIARDYLAGVYPIQSETATAVAARVLEVAMYDLPADYADTYPDKIRAVSIEKVNEVCAEFFGVKDLDIVLVGNAKQFRDGLKSLFPTAQWDEISYDNLDLLQPDLRKSKGAAAPAASAESAKRGDEIVKAAAEAAGGAALQAVDDMQITTAGTAHTPQGDFPIEVKYLIVFPDRMRSEAKLPFGLMVQGFDGKSGWASTPQGVMDLPPEYAGESQRAAALSGGWGLYKLALAGKLQTQYLGEEEWDGKKDHLVQWNALSGPIKLYFDPDTHLLAGAHFKSVSPQGASETDQHWSDYREVQGRKLPYAIVIFRNGTKFSETTVQKVSVNTKPDATVFAKPKSQ